MKTQDVFLITISRLAVVPEDEIYAASMSDGEVICRAAKLVIHDPDASWPELLWVTPVVRDHRSLGR